MSELSVCMLLQRSLEHDSRVQREARTLTRLNHEALVQYRVLAREPTLGSFYIVTEYVDGVKRDRQASRLCPGETHAS